MANISLYHQLSRFLCSAINIISCIYLVLYILSLRYYHNLSYRDPTSFFFDPDRAYARQYSTKRIAEAEAFLPRLLQQSSAAANETTRSATNNGLSDSERTQILLYLRVGNTDATEHPIFAEKWVETLPDRLLTYSPDDPDFHNYKNGRPAAALMQSCYETGAEYIAMIEDDTLAVKGWFPAALQALGTVQERAARRGQEWLYLRLFYVDGLLGWNAEEWLHYLAWSFIVWAVLTGIMVVSKKRVFKTQLWRLPACAIWLASCVLIPAAIALHFMAGRQTMWPISAGVHEMNKYGCCSQGLVFPRSIVPRFLEQTDLTTDWLVDMMIETIADRQHWTRWAVVPPLLQHIGATSSKGYGFDNSAKTIWNFRFEEYDR